MLLPNHKSLALLVQVGKGVNTALNLSRCSRLFAPTAIFTYNSKYLQIRENSSFFLLNIFCLKDQKFSCYIGSINRFSHKVVEN